MLRAAATVGMVIGSIVAASDVGGGAIEGDACELIEELVPVLDDWAEQVEGGHGPGASSNDSDLAFTHATIAEYGLALVELVPVGSRGAWRMLSAGGDPRDLPPAALDRIRSDAEECEVDLLRPRRTGSGVVVSVLPIEADTYVQLETIHRNLDAALEEFGANVSVSSAGMTDVVVLSPDDPASGWVLSVSEDGSTAVDEIDTCGRVSVPYSVIDDLPDSVLDTVLAETGLPARDVSVWAQADGTIRIEVDTGTWDYPADELELDDTGSIVSIESASNDGDTEGTGIGSLEEIVQQEACGAATDSADAAQGPEVAIAGFEFEPAELTVPVGATVTWTNTDGFDHTIKLSDPSFPQSPALAEGDTYSVTFTRPGRFTYQCGIHPQMSGTILVEQ